MNSFRVVNGLGIIFNLYLLGLFVYGFFMILKDIRRTDSFEYWPFVILSSSVIMSITLLFYFYRNIKLIPEMYKLRASSSEIIDDTSLIINEEEIEEPIKEFHPIKIWGFIFSLIHFGFGIFVCYKFFRNGLYNGILLGNFNWFFIVTFVSFIASGLMYFIGYFLIRSSDAKIRDV